VTEELDLQKCVRNLRQVELFQDLRDEQLLEVAKLCELQWKTRGDFIMREGDEPRWFYILLRGEVSISKKLQLPHLRHAPVEDRILSTIPAEGNPPLGEAALVGQAVRNATVRCTNESALYRIESSLLLELAARDPEIGHHMFRRLSEMLYQRLESTSVDVVKLSAALVYSLEE
jgi:CRP-like cAMP-binding protein